MINLGRTNTDRFALWWRNIDKLLLISILSLIFLGIFFAYASTSNIASEKIYKTDYLLIVKQIFFASISVLILVSLSLLDPKQIEKYCILGFVIAAFLLLSVLIFGVEVKGSKRWINLIFFRFQPVEIYKPFFVLLCSLIISNLQIGDLKLRIFYSFCVLFFSLLLLLNQPDVGQSLLISSVWLILIFVSGISVVALISIGSIIFFGIASAILLFSERFSYIFKRLKTFVDPSKGDNLQTQKALDAIKQHHFWNGRTIDICI
jgi:cell division protein FtsW